MQKPDPTLLDNFHYFIKKIKRVNVGFYQLDLNCKI